MYYSEKFKTVLNTVCRLSYILLVLMVAICVFGTTEASALPVNASEENASMPEGCVRVINYDPVWGDVDANCQKITQMTEECADDGAEMIVFPAMSLTGYMTAEDKDTAESVAQTTSSTAVLSLAELADTEDVWIVFGTVEKKDGKLYNAAFACSPDGIVTAYEEINPENSMFACGTKPVTIITRWGNVGLLVGNDAINTPEIIRYYSAMDSNGLTGLQDEGLCGCGIVLCCLDYNQYYNFDTDDYKAAEWTLVNRFTSLCGQEGLMIAAANLCGEENGEYFPGGSCIFAESFDEGYLFGGGHEDKSKGYFEYSLDMGKNETDSAKKLTDKDIGGDGIMESGAFIQCAPSTACITEEDFAPDRYAKQYKELADKQKSGAGFDYTVTESTDIKVAMANTNTPVWGNKKAAIENMETYIVEAGEAGADIIVFPETVLTGYSYAGDCSDYTDYNPLTGEETPGQEDVEMHVALAETIPGPTTEYLTKYAEDYNMYIAFGMTEKTDEPIYDDGVEKVYNSMAVIAPDGEICSYQKEHRAGNESAWSVCGQKPVICRMTFDGVTVNAGLIICRDGHFYPELARYLTGSGAQLLLHAVATTGDCVYREGHVGAYAHRDRTTVISVNLLGPDGPEGEGTFESTSLTASPLEGEATLDNKPINMYGTGSAAVSPEGLEYAEHVNLKGSGFKSGNLSYETLARMYDQLACYMVEGYETIYPCEHVWKHIIEPAGETNDGAEYEQCDVCGNVKDRVIINRLGDTVVSAESFTFNGRKQKPVITVIDSTGKEIAPDNYVLTDNGGKNVGAYNAVISFCNRYAGTRIVSYSINPKGTKISKLKRSRKAFRVKWKRQSAKMKKSRINGYQIRYGTQSDFENAKTKTVKGYMRTSKKIRKLKGGKKYYVQIRTYKTVNGENYYSKWSKIKSVKPR